MTRFKENIEDLEKFFSKERIQAFKKFILTETLLEDQSEIDKLTIDLYKWNLKISSSFLYVINIYEVALRNAVLEMINYKYRYSLFDDAFIKRLSFKSRQNLIDELNNYLKDNEIKDEENKIISYSTDSKRIDHSKFNINVIVSRLNLSFWDSILSKRFNGDWEHHAKRTFKNIKSHTNVYENEIKEILEKAVKIRELRNKICHAHPIYKNPKELRKTLASIYKILRKIDKYIAWFLYKNQNVTKTLRTYPLQNLLIKN